MFEGFFKKNLSLKILSLVLALFLWLVVHLTQHVGDDANKADISMELPLTVQNLSPDLLVLEAPTEVFVTISGDKKNMDEVKPSFFRAYVDVQGKEGGAYRGLPVRVASPPDYTVAAVSPPAVSVVLDVEQKKTVPVTWEVEGGKTTPRIEVKPHSVEVSGSKLQVDRVVAAEVEIPESSTASNLLQNLTPVPIDALGRPVPGLQVNPGAVQVMVLASPLLNPIAVRPLVTGTGSLQSPLEGISVTPSVVLAEIPKNVPVPPYLTTDPIDITGKQGTVIEKVKIVVPPGITLHDNNQVTVMLKLGTQ